MKYENIEGKLNGENLVPKMGPEDVAYCGSHNRKMETCGMYFDGFTDEHYKIMRCPVGGEEFFQEVANYSKDGYTSSGSQNK